MGGSALVDVGNRSGGRSSYAEVAIVVGPLVMAVRTALVVGVQRLHDVAVCVLLLLRDVPLARKSWTRGLEQFEDLIFALLLNLFPNLLKVHVILLCPRTI